MAMFARDYVETPYWWRDAPPEEGALVSELEDVDFLVIGAGLAGLNAAITLGEAGMRVAVVDALRIGEAASTRNGGQVRSETKVPYAKLKEMVGEEAAKGVLDDFSTGRVFLPNRIKALGIECNYEWTGFFFGAHTNRDHQMQIARHGAAIAAGRRLGRVVAPADVEREVQTHLYRGGYHYSDGGLLHPGLYHKGLRQAAKKLGAKLYSNCPVRSIRQTPGGFVVRFDHAEIKARKVIMTTNGYTDGVSNWIARRLIPARSYMIATEELPSGMADALIPGGAAVADTKHILYYFRTSPDRKRILFGGRASFRNTGARESAVRLHGFMKSVFPQLADVKISHAWYGNFALGFDFLPHIGVHDGVHYACACNGSGVMMLSYLGHAAAVNAMGEASIIRGLDRVPFKTRPGYFGRPWFLPIVGTAYQMRDRWNQWVDIAG